MLPPANAISAGVHSPQKKSPPKAPPNPVRLASVYICVGSTGGATMGMAPSRRTAAMKKSASRCIWRVTRTKVPGRPLPAARQNDRANGFARS